MESPRSPGSPRFSFSPEGIAVLLSGARPQRSAAYAALEGYVARRARDARHAREGSATLAAGCVAPLAAVLARPESEVDASEFQRCAHCIHGLVTLDAVAVGAEWLRDGRCWTSVAGNENAVGMAAREVPLEVLTQEHVATMASAESCFAPLFVHGMEPVFAAAGVTDASDIRREWKAPFAQCSISRMTQISALLVSALRDGQLTGEAPVAGAWQLMHTLCDGRREVALHLVQLQAIELAVAELRATPAGDWVSVERAPSPGRVAAIWRVLSTLTSHISEERTEILAAPLLTLLSATLDVLRAYETCFDTSDANVAVVYCALRVLKSLRSLTVASDASVDVLQEAASSLRFAIDHPLVYCADLNQRTDAVAMDIAAEMFGRDEAGVDDPRSLSFEFRQEEVEVLVSWRLKILDGTAGGGTVPIESFDSAGIKCLSVSDTNRKVLLKSTDLIPVLVFGLFSQADHPRGSQAVPPAKPTPEHVQQIYQCNHAEAIYHLALCEAGRALIQKHSQAVVAALQAVGSQGMTEEARACAVGALKAIGLVATEHGLSEDRVSEQHQHQQDQLSSSSPRVFLSYHTADQTVMVRLNQSLLRRGYCTYDQHQQPNEDELAQCDFILFGCSTRYKESPHCRAVAQRGQKMQKKMVALMLEHDYNAQGSWLGALLTTQQRWIAFDGVDPNGDEGVVFERRVDAVVCEMEAAGHGPQRQIASSPHKWRAHLSEAVPPSASSISSIRGGNTSCDDGDATTMTNDELGGKVKAMVIASLTEQELAAAARARGYSLVKVVDVIGALFLHCNFCSV